MRAERGNSSLYTQYPAPFTELMESGKKSVRNLLQALFDNVDDALFVLADKAANNAEQNMYFESMREIRIKRRGMEMGFEGQSSEAFRCLVEGLPYGERNIAELDDVAASSLSLVEHEELEELVAVDSMVAKAASACAASLQQLTTRLDSLVHDRSVSEQNNPFGPQVICHAFLEVCHDLDLDIKAKLVLFKLFERYVLKALSQVYEQSNTPLIERGIIPKLETKGRGKSAAAKQTYQQSVAEAKEDVFASLQGLMHQLPSSPVETQDSGLVAPGQGPQIPRESLMQLLQKVQHLQIQQMATQYLDALQGINPQQLDVQHSLNTLLSKQMPNQAMSIGQVDDDAINLVAMLFQFVLDDRNLAAPIKALIARLQIPIIKVAMLDKSFFSKGGHPARKLLNEVANASLGWMPGKTLDRDPFYQKVESIVERLLNEFSTDPAIFQDVLTDFIAFLEIDRRRTGLVEQRTVDAEDGKAKSELARSKVQAVLNEKVAGLVLPTVVIKLLEDAWSNVLFLICLQDGAEGKSWTDALRTVDELLWSVQPMESIKARQRLLKLVPILLKNLRAGLSKIGYNPFDMNQLFEDLEAIHLTQLQELSAPILDSLDEPLATVGEPREVPATLDQMLEARSENQTVPAANAAPEQQSVQDLDSELDALMSAVERRPVAKPSSSEQSALERQRVDKLVVAGTAETPPEEIVLDINDPCLQRVDGLAMGNWVEMVQEDGKRFRCRLAAIIHGTGKYIFVNRSGMKVGEYNRQSLALAIKQGQVALLDDGLLFDRALGSVIGNLRDMKN